MTIKIKICGITDLDGIKAATDAGVDAVGFVFSESPRQVDPKKASELASHLPAFIARVAVFHYPDPLQLAHVMEEFKPNVIQTEPTISTMELVGDSIPLVPVFHDQEELEGAVKMFLTERPKIQTVLVEAPGRGGQGNIPDWNRARSVARVSRMILAGGLNSNNVAEAIRAVKPYGVDVSSGVEDTPGSKDRTKIMAFVKAARDMQAVLDLEVTR